MGSSKNLAHPTAVLAALALAVPWSAAAAVRAAAQPETAPAAAEGDDAAGPQQGAAQPLPFSETCFVDFAQRSGGLRADDARRYLTPVDDHPLELEESSNSYGRAVTLKGWARLQTPWHGDSVLRLSLSGAKPLKLHFWHPHHGVTLQYYCGASGQSWVAYRTTRRPVGQGTFGDQSHRLADPAFAMLTTDDRRSGRTAGGTYCVRHQRGSLVITKGDVRLLSVPMAAAPAEVYLESAGVLLRDVAVFRGGPVPDAPVRRRPVVMRGERPARLPWKEDLPEGAALKRLADGRVQLLASGGTQLGRVSVPLIRPGLYEFILEIEDASPNTGVFLGDEQGRAVHAVGFFRDPTTGGTYLAHDQPAADATAKSPDIDAGPAPYVGRRQLLRLVAVGGLLKCFTSGDGVHWGQALPPRRSAGAPVMHVGLYSRPATHGCSIKLSRLEIRRLDAIHSLAPVELQERAETLAVADFSRETIELGAWRQHVCEIQPPGTDAAAWQRACAVVALAGGAAPPLADALIDRLLADGLCCAAPVEAKLRLIEDAALLYDAPTTQDAVRFAVHCERLGQALLREDDLRAFDFVRRALMTAPPWSQDGPIEPLPETLAGDQLLALTAHERWDDTLRLCRQLAFWHRPAKLSPAWPAAQAKLGKLVGWAQARAQRALPSEADDRQAAMPAVWRHPLIVYPNKEAYNTYAELQATLRERSYRTACQILTSAVAREDWGLLADTRDDQLLMTLPAAIALTMRQHPKLQETMNDELGEADLMRLRRAMADGRLAAVEAATLQYFGTPLAAEAFVWLGDRLTADGQFAPAIARYRQALPMATPEQRHQLSARIRLAAAMLGRAEGEPVGEPVVFGDIQLAPAQFEALVTAMLAKHGKPADGQVHAGTAARGGPAPPPARFAPQPWAAFQGDMGTKPEEVPAGAKPVDWAARQLAVVPVDSTLIVSNRFQVTAFDLATKAVKWRHSLGERQGPTHALSLVPMRPQVADGRLYARLLNDKSRPQLDCLELESGRLLWTGRYRGWILCDPLVAQGRVLVLGTGAAGNEPISELMLVTLDPKTGAVLSERPLVQLRDQWTLRRVCEATVAGDKIVAAVAGAVLCCDTFGQMHWVRRNTWVPPAVEAIHGRQHRQPPLVADPLVYVAQGGARSVDCLDLPTGRLRWRRTMPHIRRLLELIDGRLLVETDFGLHAVDAQTGRTLWRHRAGEILDVYPHGGQGGILYVRSELVAHQRHCPVLVWLDAATGAPKARCPLPSLAAKQPFVGPLVGHRNRLWCFTGVPDDKDVLQPQRNILELTAAGAALPGDDRSPSQWSTGVDDAMRSAAAMVLPGWEVLSAAHDEKTGWQASIAGKADVLVTKAAETPVRLGRRISVPSGGKPRLLLEIGHDPQSASKVQIRAEGLILQQFTPQPTTAAAAWQQLAVDLSAHAGRDVWITIVQEQAGDAAAYMYWKRMELIP